MRAIPINKVQPGMVLAKSVYSPDGRVLLREGAALTDRYLMALRSLNFNYVYIVDPRAPEISLSDPIPEELRQEAISVIKRAFGGDINAQKVGTHLPSISEVTKQLVDSIISNRDVTVQMADLKSHNTYTFAHSVNVSILGTMLGHRAGLNALRLQDLALGLILHDIGKMQVPVTILDKPGKLTESEFTLMKEHARSGYDALRGLMSLSAHAKIVVLQHHEKYDGSGYPKGLKGDDIHLNAQIGAIVDVYDALTSDRIYRKRFLPHEALEYMKSGDGSHFCPTLLRTFLDSVAPYPPGTLLKLSSGEIAIVAQVDMKAASRPIVKVIQDAEGQDIVEFRKLVDLQQQPGLTITKVLNDE